MQSVRNLQESATFCTKVQRFEKEYGVTRKTTMSLQRGQSTLGDFLRTLRTSRRIGLTAAATAAGVHRTTLHRWEQSEVLPRLAELEALLSALQADAKQKRQALLLLDAPRAKNQVRAEIVRIGDQLGIGTMPSGGDLLRALRLRRRLSLEEVANRIQTTSGTLRRWEKMEVWPSLEQLHRLCYALGAHEQEVVALTVGRFAQVGVEKETVSIEALQQNFDDINASHFELMQSQLMDISFLTLESRCWFLAARSAAGRRLLAQIYTRHAHFLGEQGSFEEMGQYADRALDIAPEKSTGEAFWLTARIYSAETAIRRKSKAGNRRSIERFRQLLPFARTPEMECWLLSWIGDLLVEDNAEESGLFFLERACQVAGRSDDPIHRRLRENDKAQALLMVNKPAEALPLIGVTPEDNPYFRTGLHLKQTEAYLAMDKASDAHDHLHQAYNIIETHHILYLRSQADALAVRL